MRNPHRWTYFGKAVEASSIGRSMEEMVGAPTVVAPENWHPANGGTEVPFRTRTGRTVLYCWQPSTGRHAYLDCGTDLILSDEDAAAALDLR